MWVRKVGKSRFYPHSIWVSVKWIARNNEASCDRVLQVANTGAYRQPSPPASSSHVARA
jgi:hypothetical protein